MQGKSPPCCPIPPVLGSVFFSCFCVAGLELEPSTSEVPVLQLCQSGLLQWASSTHLTQGMVGPGALITHQTGAQALPPAPFTGLLQSWCPLDSETHMCQAEAGKGASGGPMMPLSLAGSIIQTQGNRAGSWLAHACVFPGNPRTRGAAGASVAHGGPSRDPPSIFFCWGRGASEKEESKMECAGSFNVC